MVTSLVSLLGSYSRTIYDIVYFGLVEMASRPIRSIRNIVTCTIIQPIICICGTH